MSCPPILVTLVQIDTQPQRSLFAAAPTPAGSRGVRLTLCDGPTLSETRGRPFVAPRAAVSRQVCTRPPIFVTLVQHVTQPQRSLFAAASDASRQPGCAVDIVRWPDTVGDSGAAVCGSSGGGVSSSCPPILVTWSNLSPSLNAPCLLLLRRQQAAGVCG